MADFKIAYDITNSHEGGYSFNPKDKGCETYKGISRKYWPNWVGWKIIDASDKKHLDQNTELQTLVADFYKKNFWDKLMLDGLNNQDLGNEIYDTGVNLGVPVAALFLQRLLNVANDGGRYYPDIKVDGNIGKVTLSAANRHPYPDVLRKGINCLQGAKYIDIAETNKSQEVFINGWFLNRI